MNVSGGSYVVQINKIMGMKIKGNLYQCVPTRKISINANITKQNSAYLYHHIEKIFTNHDRSRKANHLTVKTIAKIDVSKYDIGEEVDFGRERISQKIIVNHSNGAEDVLKLDTPMAGFPISNEVISDLENFQALQHQ